jgi:hypothetical protein
MTYAVAIENLTGPHALAVEHETRDGRVARRNVLLGLWAAHRLGLAGQDAETYAWSVHFADLGAPGYDDVVAKVAADFEAAGQSVTQRTIRSVLREMEARAELQLADDPA